MTTMKCPKCGKQCKNLTGLKQHLSSTHGGYTDAELQQYLGGGSPSDNVQARMDAFADRLDVAGTDGAEPVSGAAPAPQQPAPAAPTEKRVKATPKKLKKLLGGIPAKILESAHVEIDADDEEVLDEAGEFLADIFGVEFSVPESKYLVQSRFLAVLWVAGVTMLIVLKHRFPQVWASISADKKKKPEQKPMVQ